MEVCLCCGTTTSSALKGNTVFEQIAERLIGLAVRAGDIKALHELAQNQLSEIGRFSTTGSTSSGTSAQHKLRRVRIAVQALQAAEAMLEPIASDEVHFDGNGHVI